MMCKAGPAAKIFDSVCTHIQPQHLESHDGESSHSRKVTEARTAQMKRSRARDGLG